MHTSSWIEALEHRFGHWAIPNLIRSIVALNILAWLLDQFSPGFTGMLVLDPEAVYAGEFWRIFTFLFIPPPGRSTLLLLLFFYVAWLIGEYLESEWGAFRVNLYYLIGMLALAFVSFFVVRGQVDNVYLNSSLFLALGTVIPEMTFYVYFVLPVKAKYLAWFTGGSLALAAFFMEGQFFIVLASVLNYLLFFGPAYLQGKKEEHEARQRRKRFQSGK